MAPRAVLVLIQVLAVVLILDAYENESTERHTTAGLVVVVKPVVNATRVVVQHQNTFQTIILSTNLCLLLAIVVIIGIVVVRVAAAAAAAAVSCLG